MGGADTEVSESTTDLVIESAEFAPLSIRGTARKLNLHSPSSYRFERGVDPEKIDWASRRCCELILDIAGGELAEGVISVGREIAPRQPIVLRFSQLKRILGIDVPADPIRRILTALGNRESSRHSDRVEVIPPSWRRDLAREIDLVEEVARIHGYDQIPEDVSVPMAPSHRTGRDRVVDKIRQVLTSAGMDETMTASVVREEWSTCFSPWTTAEPIVACAPMLKGADHLRRSLIPSLLDARRINESLSNPTIELFETAHVYLPQRGSLPKEQRTLAITSGGNFSHVKGLIETLVASLKANVNLQCAETDQQILDRDKSCCLTLNGTTFGYLGELATEAAKQFSLRSPTTVAELNIEILEVAANLIPQYREESSFPAIARDLNMIVDESFRWADLAKTVARAVGDYLEELTYQETYRSPQQDGPGKKRLLFSLTLRSHQRTMTNEEADQIRQRVVEACQQAHGAKLLG
jgi:phenylalanyl-tRNA synthetase beta chain